MLLKCKHHFNEIIKRMNEDSLWMTRKYFKQGGVSRSWGRGKHHPGSAPCSRVSRAAFAYLKCSGFRVKGCEGI